MARLGGKPSFRAMSNIAQRFRAARGRSNLSRPRLAEAACVSYETVKRIENGLGGPSRDSMHRLCAVLDVSMEWLLLDEPLDFRSVAASKQEAAD